MSLPLYDKCPSGRVELLDWLNFVTCAAYDSLEQLGDGVLYCQVLEMCITQAAPFLQRLTSFDCVLSDADGPVQMERRERNLHLFQAQIRDHIEKRAGIEINVPRLAQGKLQDHVNVAKWLYGLANKLVKSRKGLRFVMAAEARRAEAAASMTADGTVNPNLVRRQAFQLRPAADAYVRSKRMQYASALQKLEVVAAPAPAPPPPPSATQQAAASQHGTSGSSAAHRGEFDPAAYATPAQPAAPQRSTSARGEHQHVQGDAEVDALLDQLQHALVAKARNVTALQTNLSKFIEMRDLLLRLSMHVRQQSRDVVLDTEAQPADRRVGAELIALVAGHDAQDDEDLDLALDTIGDPYVAMAIADRRTSCNPFAVLGEATA